MVESKTPVIQELNFYPVKSLRGLRTNELQIDKAGALWDRQWMLIDEKNVFITQRTMPKLATIGLKFDEAGIELSRHDHGSVDFALEETEGDAFPVTVWKSTVKAREVSSEVSEWISRVMDKKIRLVRMEDEGERLWNAEDPDTPLRFTDSRPLLVISRASLEALEAKAGVTLATSRFRPNIVLNHVPAHAEDGFAGFAADGMEFQALKPCMRCKITCTHPLTGEVGEEPLKTLATYRREEKGIAFGYYYTAVKPGTLKLGAPVSPR